MLGSWWQGTPHRRHLQLPEPIPPSDLTGNLALVRRIRASDRLCNQCEAQTTVHTVLKRAPDKVKRAAMND
jgi:hypothetical protein